MADDIEDLEEFEEEESGPSWTAFLVLGIFTGVAFGAILMTLMRERQRELHGLNGNPYPIPPMPQLPPGPQVIVPPINIYNMYGGSNEVPNEAPVKKAKIKKPLADAIEPNEDDDLDAYQNKTQADEANVVSSSPNMDTRLATVTLSSTESSRLLKATGGVGWLVQVRTVGPPGRYAFFSTDSNSFQGGIAPADTIALPAGQHHDVYLPAGQYLFAMGSAPATGAPTDSVVISFSGRAMTS